MRVDIITSAFPDPYETFIEQEIRELSLHFDVIVHTLKPGLESDLSVKKHSIFSLKNLFSFTKFIFLKPLEMTKIFFELLSGFANCPRKNERIKSFAVWPLACRLAHNFPSDTLVLAHWANVPSTIAWIIFRLRKIPYVLEIHGENISSFWPHLKIKCSEAQSVLTCTEFIKQRIEENMPDFPVSLCRHGTKITAQKRADEKSKKPLKGLTVGRLVPTKGYETLILSLKELKERKIDFKWTIIGEGPTRNLLERMVKGLHLTEHIRFMGRVEHKIVLKNMLEHHVFALPIQVGPDGDSDGLPNVILEAMAHGCPVVSTPVAGVCEALDDEKTGLLVDPKDPIKLAEAFVRLSQDDNLRKNIIENSHEKVAAFFDEKHCSKHFVEIVAQNHPSYSRK